MSAPPRKLFGTHLVLPPNARDVTAENAGKMFAIVDPRPLKDEAPAPTPAPSPAPPERK